VIAVQLIQNGHRFIVGERDPNLQRDLSQLVFIDHTAAVDVQRIKRLVRIVSAAVSRHLYAVRAVLMNAVPYLVHMLVRGMVLLFVHPHPNLGVKPLRLAQYVIAYNLGRYRAPVT